MKYRSLRIALYGYYRDSMLSEPVSDFLFFSFCVIPFELEWSKLTQALCLAALLFSGLFFG
jgi:hypothetical protein